MDAEEADVRRASEKVFEAYEGRVLDLDTKSEAGAPGDPGYFGSGINAIQKVGTQVVEEIEKGVEEVDREVRELHEAVKD